MRDLIVTPRFRRDWRRLDRAIRLPIDEAIRAIAVTGFQGQDIRKLQHHPVAAWRLRVGDYRVLFDMDGASVILLRVRHRKDVYR